LLAGVPAPQEVAPGEVVPAALGADLDHVAGELVAVLAEAVELALVRDAAAVGGLERVAVDVGHQPQLRLLADRALLLGLLPEMAGGPDELRVGVAVLGPADLPRAPLAQDRSASEAVVDSAAHRIECTEAGRAAIEDLSVSGRSAVFDFRPHPCNVEPIYRVDIYDHA